MRCSLLLLALALLGGSGQAAIAQTTTSTYDPSAVQRTVRPLEVWPELQAELALRNGDYLLLALRGERSTAAGTYLGRSLGFDTRRLAVAYEHFWNAHWSWGGTARYESDARLESTIGGNLVVPELLLRHRAPLFGGLTFGQRLGVERQFPVNTQNTGGSGTDGQFWGRLRVDVERLFVLSNGAATGLAVRPRLSYEASTHMRFQKAASDQDERTIQFTRLRGEIGIRFSPQVDVTPWFAYQTQYNIEVPQYQYDANGKQIQVRGGKLNDVYPTLGLDLRFTLIPSVTKADRQQLPTQH